MRTITNEYKIFTFKEASPEMRNRIREEFHFNSYIAETMLDERIETLKALAQLIDGTLDYHISVVPDRGEFITIKPKYDELDFQKLYNVIDSGKECPLTGVCYDHDILDKFEEAKTDSDIDALNYALNEYVEAIHKEYEWMMSDEYLLDHCEANGYEFYESGRFFAD